MKGGEGRSEGGKGRRAVRGEMINCWPIGIAHLCPFVIPDTLVSPVPSDALVEISMAYSTACGSWVC